ncbi:sulfatase-like hydrolase/transferase [Nocardia sp. alder85J]|uniref:sulfatase-like hydrolase/transferase n=1 Tax=Nocardia sp. alder85J TaxID=2862949 RepID=UPI001CD77434|nr:sulfatase-like hydrolase/transferase [Nocardia sp. alder85J]MCX4095845.1 sulfatase-like hydrolase/transferase [Nocardia sp. alder85J]
MAITDPNRRQLLAMLAAVATVPLLSAGPAAADTPRRNILILMTDQERAHVVLPAGFALPARSALAERGVFFGAHHTPTAPCSPARSTIFTGLHAPVTGVIDNVGNSEYTSPQLTGGLGSPSLDTAVPTLGTLLRQAGYHTAYIGKWHLSDPVGTTPDALSAYGFDEAIDILGGGSPDEGLHNDPGVADRAVAWLDRHRDDRQPWLCVVSFVNPHDMMFCPRFYRLADVPDHGAEVPVNFESDLSGKPRVQSLWRVENQAVGGPMPTDLASAEAKTQWRQWGNWYLELLRNTDDLMARVLTALDDSGRRTDTVVAQLADHGEMGGAHGLRQKGAMIYRENLNVPLVISDPDRPAGHGSTVDTPTSHIDLVPTLAALAGIDATGLTRTHGIDLTPLLTPSGTATARDAILVTSDAKSSGGLPGVEYCLRGAITDQYSFARYSTAEHLGGPDSDRVYELYDRRNDPYELNDLARQPGSAALIGHFNSLVDELAARQLDATG